jgi:hypothetical protein
MNNVNPRRSLAVTASVSPRIARSNLEFIADSDRMYAASACRISSPVRGNAPRSGIAAANAARYDESTPSRAAAVSTELAISA